MDDSRDEERADEDPGDRDSGDRDSGDRDPGDRDPGADASAAHPLGADEPDGGPDDDPGDGDPGGDDPGDGDPGGDDPGGDDPGDDPDGGPGPDSPGPDSSGPGGPRPDRSGPDRVGSTGPAGAGGQPWVRDGVEVRRRVATLLGLDQRPGEIPGLGPVLPSIARSLVAGQLRGARWRFAVADDHGYLLLAGTTRHRPHPTTNGNSGNAGPSGRSRGGIVELHLPASGLDQLARAGAAAEFPPGWASLIADIAAQYADRDRLLTDLNNHPEDRFAHAALARHIEVRDRTCSHMGCRRPARRCDLDHTHDHAAGGATVTINIGPDCTRHHFFKHQLGWQVAQPEPGVFVWTSPLRQIYRTRGEPIALPRPDQPPDPPESTRRWWHGPTLRLPDPPPPPKPRPPPPDPNEPPPF